MGYYSDALEWESTAIAMEACGKYRGSVYMSCLAVECFLKSKVEFIDPNNGELFKHDSIYLYRFLKSKYPSGKDISRDITLCRKYHNDSRYSNSARPEIFDKSFANRFIQIITEVKNYIDNDCAASLDDLAKKYNKHNNISSDPYE